MRAQRDRCEPSLLREAGASATESALYETGFGGFGFLGFGGLFGVLSPTWHLLLVRIGRSAAWLLAGAARPAASTAARERPDAPVRFRDVELQRQRLAGNPERRVSYIVIQSAAAGEGAML